jgi:hypothetical protein
MRALCEALLHIDTPRSSLLTYSCEPAPLERVLKKWGTKWGMSGAQSCSFVGLTNTEHLRKCVYNGEVFFERGLAGASLGFPVTSTKKNWGQSRISDLASGSVRRNSPLTPFFVF